MAHFAELDADNNVMRVVVVHNSDIMDGGSESEQKGVAFLAALYGHERWKQTSYSGSMRKNYAAAGHKYDSVLDAFIAPRPYPSWRLDAASCRWAPPLPYPDNGKDMVWHEDSASWVEQAHAG